jgi:hypothetical protein
VLGEADAFWRGDLEKLEHSVGSRPVELGDCLLVLLRRHGAEDEIVVVFYFPLFQHCKPEGVSSQTWSFGCMENGKHNIEKRKGTHRRR